MPRVYDNTIKTHQAFVLDSVVEYLTQQVDGGSQDVVVKDTLCLLIHYRELTR